MTDSEWRECREPQPMLAALRNAGKLSERKARLFAVACCRHIFHLLKDERTRRVVELAEQYADGGIGLERLVAAYREADSARDHSTTTVQGQALALASIAALWAAATEAVSPDGGAWGGEPPDPWYNATLAADHVASATAWAGRAGPDKIATRAAESVLLRDLFGPLPFRPVILPPSVRTWNGGTVVRLAQAAYDNRRLPAGTLDPERLLVLADALEEAGCRDQEVLTHLRGREGHWRGCWVLDSLLGKS